MSQRNGIRIPREVNHQLWSSAWGSTSDDSGATTVDQRQCVLATYGIGSTIQTATVENVDAALRDGRGVIISADVSVLWKGQDRFDPTQRGGHAVVVTHGGYDENGNLLGVYVNDTGIGSRYFLSKTQLQDALASRAVKKINVTNDRIWPVGE